tara:strand:- start:81 stop:377 length:297 start_codon:yes stop_codon:yes gene_type:complete
MSDIQKWDYFVIHINFEEQDKTNLEKSQEASDKLGGSLSKEYLEKEFPEQFKSTKPGLHPSKQLEIILKRFGDEGWKLQTTERIGNLLMFIFMRKKPK